MTDDLENLINSFGGDKVEALKFLNEQILREQEIYWQRFSSFAGLNAGTLVLATSNSISDHRLIIGVGICLSILWAYIQIISLRYADRAKPMYHDLRRIMGIKFAAPKSKLSSFIYKAQFLSSTDAGILCTMLVFCLWLIAFFEP
ncbi:hypothetical protein [Spirulina sp. 06S082]|uniref:hypothetical protein n=1 Tax=Spirulina sp. 06S082 TaxID=3110248 RepID=UPI002B1FCA12|nr:hypothetical protein [Spirulina sp. 06S082]MEA5472473.1 hypothetical protein [Spirulina sp. 06S082]